jgi:hypothetical protein
MLNKDNDHKGSIKINCGHEPEEAWRQDELIGGKPLVIK